MLIFMPHILDTSEGIKSFLLEQLKKIATSIAMTHAFSGQATIKPLPIIGGLAVLRVTQPRLFAKAKLGTLIYQEIEQVLALNIHPDLVRDFDLNACAELWMYLTKGPLREDTAKDVAGYFSKYHIYDHTRILPIIAGRVMDRFFTSSQ